MRVCSTPGCPELTPKAGRCPTCSGEHERRRGTRQARGYDAAFDRTRKKAAPQVAKGVVTCWSCNKRISTLDPWDQGHCDLDRSVIHGPQHQACNRDTSQAGCAHVSHI